MLFNSYLFVLFMLPLSIIGYYQFNKHGKNKLGLIYILGLSIWFIGYMNIMYLAAVIPSVIVNYFISREINGAWAQDNKGLRKLLTICGIVLDVVVLFIFKYYDFFADSINTGLKLDIPTINLLMPLGISFYTFQEITYLADCYKDKNIHHSILEYGLYICFFPQFIQGPIVLQSELIPQFNDDNKKSLDFDYLSKGLYRFVLGLAKKVLFADMLALIVDAGYGKIDELNSISALTVILAYTLQIYYDFSGYSDMAIGIANMLHIDLPENFNSPYKACGIDEFWDRWHITLTRFFTRYIYIPLGGNRKGRVRTYANVFFIFLISGLWHGSEWSFVLWGAMHGVAMLIRRLIKECKSLKIHSIISGLVTFVFVNVAWVFFRAQDVGEALNVLKHVISGGWLGLDPFLCEEFENTVEASLLIRADILGLNSYFTGLFGLLFVIALVIVAICTRNTRELAEKWKPTKKTAIVTVALAVWCILSFSGITKFVYWDF